MTRRWMLLVALLATAAWSGSAMALFHDYFPDGADGSLDVYTGGTFPTGMEGYASGDEGQFRLATWNNHFGFLDFRTEYSDGPDRLREGFTGDLYDGNLLGDTTATRGSGAGAYGPSPAWYIGKKIVSAYLYIRDLSNGCSILDADGADLQEPVQVYGFRCGNAGPFIDRGWWFDTNSTSTTYLTWRKTSGQNAATSGCCAGYSNSQLLFGEMGPPAWRMGQWRNFTGSTYTADSRYTTAGDIGDMTPFPVPGSSPAVTVTPEYWKVSVKDPNVAYAGKTLIGGTAPLSSSADISSGTALGGFAGTSTSMFAAAWLVRTSTAHLVNSISMTKATCSDPYFGGTTNPRAMGTSAGTSNWYGIPIDPVIIQALAAKPDGAGGASDAAGGAKGIVFRAYDPITGGPIGWGTGSENFTWNSRDQGGDHNADFCPYLDLRATYAGDANNDGTVNVTDLQALVAHWNSVGNPVSGVSTSGSYSIQVDWTLDGFVNVGDLQQLVSNWAKVAPNQP